MASSGTDDLEIIDPGHIYQTPFLCALNVHEIVHAFALDMDYDISGLLDSLHSLTHYYAIVLPSDTLNVVANKALPIHRKRKRRVRRAHARSSRCVDTNHIVPAPAQYSESVQISPPAATDRHEQCCTEHVPLSAAFDTEFGNSVQVSPLAATVCLEQCSAEYMPLSAASERRLFKPTKVSNSFTALSSDGDDEALEVSAHAGSELVADSLKAVHAASSINADLEKATQLPIGQGNAHTLPTSSLSSRSQGDQSSTAVLPDGPLVITSSKQQVFGSLKTVHAASADIEKATQLSSSSSCSQEDVAPTAVLSGGLSVSTALQQQVHNSATGEQVSPDFDKPPIALKRWNRTPTPSNTNILWLPVREALGNYLLMESERSDQLVAIRPSVAVRSPGLAYRRSKLFTDHDSLGRYLEWGKSVRGCVVGDWFRVEVDTNHATVA